MNSGLSANHPDIDSVQRSLSGDETAVRDLFERITPFLTSLLVSRGASQSTAEDLLEELWTDCLTGTNERPPLLHRYTGASPLRSWLFAILFNRWISLRRREAVQSRAWDRIGRAAAGGLQEFRPGEYLEREMMVVLEQAVRKAVEACDAEEIVLLQLVHLHGVSQRDLARLAGCHESQLSRRLKATEKKIAEGTFAAVHTHDPLLDLTWDDFLHLYECANVLDELG